MEPARDTSLLPPPSPTSNRPWKLCFYCWAAYPIFRPSSQTIFGGAEVRSTNFAKALAKRPEFDVSFMTADEGQTPGESIDGVKLFPDRAEAWISDRFFWKAYQGYLRSCETRPRFPFLRIKQWNPNLLWQAPALAFHRFVYAPYRLRSKLRPRVRPYYRQHAFDAYCCFHINEITADIVATCQQTGTRSIVFLISDDDVRPPIPQSEMTLDLLWRKAHPYVLANADLIIAQTEHQAEQLLKNYGRSCVIIRNPVDLTGASPGRSSANGEFAFWIGRAQPAGYNFKRPELLLELARKCPDIPFFAIANADHPLAYQAMIEQKPANLTIVDKVPYAEVERLFQRARVFVSVSAVEGFPNTFLQAAKYSIPILSLRVDPTNMLAVHGAGKTFGDDLNAMAEELNRLWSRPEELNALGRNARTFVETHHDITSVANALAQTIAEELSRPRIAAGRAEERR